MCLLPTEELLSLLGSGLVGVADEDLDEALGGSGRGQVIGEEVEESGGRESRVSLYEFSNPLMQVSSSHIIALRYSLWHWAAIFIHLQNEVRSLVSLGDGAAGGGSTSSGTPLSGDRSTVPPMSNTGGSSRTGESREKRGNGGGSSARAKLTIPTSRNGNNSSKKKEGPSGPLLYDRSSEWWGGAKVCHADDVMSHDVVPLERESD